MLRGPANVGTRSSQNGHWKQNSHLTLQGSCLSFSNGSKCLQMARASQAKTAPTHLSTPAVNSGSSQRTT